jgi:hypothetical protein
MRPLALLFAVCCLPAVGTARAQPADAAPGAQSRASVRITVSVAPVFTKELAPERTGATGTTTLRATDKSLRYTLVRVAPMQGTPSNRPLVLVVPD